MTDVLIQHCRLRIVRKGGWTWGPDRQHLIDMATKALPGLLADALSHLVENADGDVTVGTLAVRLGPRAAQILGSRGESGLPAEREVLRQALVRQLRPQLPEIAAASPQQPPERRRATQPPAHIEPCDIAHLIVAWYRDGSLQPRLAWFSPAALQAWEAALLASLPLQPRAGTPFAYEPPAHLRALFAKPPAAHAATPRAHYALRLLLAADILASNPGTVRAPDLRTQLDLFVPELPTPQDHPVAESSRQEHAATPPPEPAIEFLSPATRHHPPARPLPHRPAIGPIDTRVFSAIPFLVLGVLHRMGYLRTLAAALELSGAGPLAAAFATAFAYKLLRAPESGWHRDPDSLHAAAVFAGLDAPLEQEALRAFERQAGTQLSAIDADIAAALRAGYDARNALLLQKVDRDYLCFDTAGMFPVAFAASPSDIESLLRSFGPAVVFVDAATISSALAEGLDRNSCAFLTDAQPGRGDRWQPLDRQRQYWTSTAQPAPAAFAESYSARMEESREFVEHFMRQRPVFAVRPRASAEASLDRSATLAAGAGLAQLAYTLWHGREPTSAVLAFQRFHDLEARVQIDEQRILVRLALGRRFFDLREHGLLRDITGVPWWDGRTLQFAES